MTDLPIPTGSERVCLSTVLHFLHEHAKLALGFDVGVADVMNSFPRLMIRSYCAQEQTAVDIRLLI
jgi:hypothetical protein